LVSGGKVERHGRKQIRETKEIRETGEMIARSRGFIKLLRSPDRRRTWCGKKSEVSQLDTFRFVTLSRTDMQFTLQRLVLVLILVLLWPETPAQSGAKACE